MRPSTSKSSHFAALIYMKVWDNVRCAPLFLCAYLFTHNKMMFLIQRLLSLPTEITNPDISELKDSITAHHWTFVRFAAPWCAYT